MIKRAFLLILILTLISVLLFSCAARNTDTDGSEEDVFDAVYIGVEDYGRADRNTVLNPESCVFIFDTDSGQKTYKIDCEKYLKTTGRIMRTSRMLCLSIRGRTDSIIS